MQKLYFTLTMLVASVFFAAHMGAASAEKNYFTLTDKDGQPIGNAVYTVSRPKGGYRIESKFEYKIKPEMVASDGQNNSSSKRGGTLSTAPSTTFSLQMNDDIELDESGQFLSGYVANGQMMMMRSYTPSKDRKTLDVREMKGQNVTDQKTLNMQGPEYLLAPQFDPGAIQALMIQAKLRPRADKTYTLLVPPAQMGGTNRADLVIMQPLDDTAGERDGKEMQVKAYLLNFHEGHAEVFTDSDGNLMEAAMANLHARFVREGFKLAAQRSVD